MMRLWGICAGALSMVLAGCGSEPSEEGEAEAALGLAEISAAIRWDVSPALRDLQRSLPGSPDSAQRPVAGLQLQPGQAGARPNLPAPADLIDPVEQTSATRPIEVVDQHRFTGLGDGFVGPQGRFVVPGIPPDPNGAPGRTQYVQWVNTSFAVFDKASGVPVLGPIPGNALWSGFGGPCETHNDGDPIAQYDKEADRWVLTQFAIDLVGHDDFQCVAVSTSPDATGSYFRYAFKQPNLNDYPKLGVWPDAYYVTFNMFDVTQNFAFLGGRVCALDRAAMLVGAPATQQCFDVPVNGDSMLPSDLDGKTPPPVGSPNYVLNLGVNALNVRKFHVDWVNPTNSTLTGPELVPVAPFTPGCVVECVPQLGTSQKLDEIGDRLMYRLGYRRFPGDGREALVANHTVTASDGQGAVRWYELRITNGHVSVFQQGTYAPDSSFRWMGSIAMDHESDIAVGYSVSSELIHPSIRFSGRRRSDPLGQLRREESVVHGEGSQTPFPPFPPAGSRWGDYTAMTMDPVDDCTFWYTNEYHQTNGVFNWRTRIANFKFPNCH